MATGSRPPLHGITVLALEHAIAAPLCTRQLADLGARVIKVERRESGDFARHYDDRAQGLCSHFVWTNRAKQSLTLDLKHPQVHAILPRLLEKADVLVQNLAPGAAQRLGLDYPTLQPDYPRLIVCDISGYGATGPYAGRKAYDLLIQAEAGFLSVTGAEEQMAKAGISIADIAAGTQAHSAILAALLQRHQTGAGGHVQVSLLDALVEWMGYPLYYAYDGAQQPARTGADHASIFPYGAFQTGDGQQVMLGLQNEREWQSFCTTVLEQPQLAADSRFSNNAARSSRRDTLRSIIEAAFARLGADAVRQRLDAAGIAHAHVNDMQAVWDHPQLRALKRTARVETAVGSIDTWLPAAQFSSHDPQLGPVPGLGQHTRIILAELGFSDEQIDSFQEAALI